MNQDTLYRILQSVFANLSEEEPSVKALPERFDPGLKLEEMGLDVFTMGALEHALELRLDGRILNLSRFALPEGFSDVTLGDLFQSLMEALRTPCEDPVVVYVDDEEDNLFVFRRIMKGNFRLQTFTDPEEALKYIEKTDEVGLVITDEVMPGLRGTELCDRIHLVKPMMKFVLITGNPEHDESLMYRTLRHNKFYEFLSKPVNYTGKKQEYLQMIHRLIGKA